MEDISYNAKMITYRDSRGDLITIQPPFEPRSMFLLKDIKERGYHKNKKTRQCFYILQGSVSFNINGRVARRQVGEYFIIEPDAYRILSDASPDCIILVLCSEEYSSNDYIRIPFITYSDVTEKDVKNIINLRTNPKALYLNPIEDDIQKQIDFINRDRRQGNRYFKFSINMEFVGFYRLYKNMEGMWEYGSFIIKDNPPPKAGILLHCAMMDIVFTYTGLACHTCDPHNEKIIAFHERLGTPFIKILDNGQRYYEITWSDWDRIHPFKNDEDYILEYINNA